MGDLQFGLVHQCRALLSLDLSNMKIACFRSHLGSSLEGPLQVVGRIVVAMNHRLEDSDKEEEPFPTLPASPWYEAPFDSPSRREESWVRHQDGKDRIIECLTSKRKNQWTPLPHWVTEKLLEVYDQEEIGAKVQDIALWIDDSKQLYTYRVEGGPWLTQWNQKYPDNAPRSVRVKIVESSGGEHW